LCLYSAVCDSNLRKNMLLRFISFLFIGTLLSGCGDTNTPDSPAEDQIKDYTKELEDCKDNTAKKSQQQKKEVVKEEVTHIRGFAIEPDDIIFGNEDAKIVLLEYFSPTCPACSYYHKRVFPEVKRKYIDTGKIAYVMREFIGNKQDFDATILARCKGDKDNYVKFMDIILERQDNWAFTKNYRNELTNLGMAGGISQIEYEKCLNNQNLNFILLENTKFVTREPSFMGTPSFFINGEHFSMPYTIEDLSSEIDKKLK